MRRGLWFLAGTAAGVYATAKVRRAAEAFTVDGLHDRLTGWFAGARVLGDEIDAGRRVKETELRERLSLGPHGSLGAGPDNVRQLTAVRRDGAERSEPDRPEGPPPHELPVTESTPTPRKKGEG